MMEIGMIQSPRELAWKKGEERTVRRAAAFEGSVILSKADLFSGSAVKAWNCVDCRKIVIDYKVSPDMNR